MIASLVAREAQAEITPECATAFDEAVSLRHAHKFIASRGAYAKCVATCTQEDVLRDCKDWHDQLDASIPSIDVRVVTSAGAVVRAFTTEIDGKAMEHAPLEVDPDEHVVTAHAAGTTVEERVVVHLGERPRVVELRLPGAPVQTVVSRPIRWPTILASIVTVSAAGAGAAFETLGATQYSALGSCTSTRTCRPDDVNAAKTATIAGDVLVGTAIVAVVLTVLTYVLRPTHHDRQPLVARVRF